MLLLTGKNVVVIGGNRGVGRQIVEAASRNGAHVLAVARQEAPLRLGERGLRRRHSVARRHGRKGAFKGVRRLATRYQRYPDGRPPAASRPSPAQQKLLDRYLRAWEGHDLDGFAALLKEDATFTMPPWLQCCGGVRLVPTAANRQPAFAVYTRTGVEPPWVARAIHVLTLEQEMISTLAVFLEPAVFRAFGLPLTLADAAGAESPSTPPVRQ
jgi:hypothetical protein